MAIKRISASIPATGKRPSGIDSSAITKTVIGDSIAVKPARSAKKVSHKAEKKQFSELAMEIRDAMIQGLRTPNPEFDLTKLNEAVSIFPQIDANSAEDSTREDRALFNISTNGDTPQFTAVKTLVTGLNQINNEDDDNFNPGIIEDAARILFMNVSGHEDGTAGQRLVRSIHEITNSKRKKLTHQVENHMDQLQALDKFLQALQIITKDKFH